MHMSWPAASKRNEVRGLNKSRLDLHTVFPIRSSTPYSYPTLLILLFLSVFLHQYLANPLVGFLMQIPPKKTLLPVPVLAGLFTLPLLQHIFLNSI